MPRRTARSSKGGRTETGMAREGRGGVGTRKGTVEGKAGRSGEGSRVRGEKKRSPLVKDVSEYWEVYEGDGAN